MVATAHADMLDELMVDDCGFPHMTGRTIKKQKLEHVHPVVIWEEKTKKWCDWANIEEDTFAPVHFRSCATSEDEPSSVEQEGDHVDGWRLHILVYRGGPEGQALGLTIGHRFCVLQRRRASLQGRRVGRRHFRIKRTFQN